MTNPQHQIFRDAMAASMDVDPGTLTAPGVSVKPSAERAENHVTAAYVFDDHLVVTCDPAAEGLLKPAETSLDAPTLDAWTEFAAELEGELLGAGRMQLLTSHDMPVIEAAPGYQLRRLNKDDAADFALIEELVDTSDEDDLDEVELDITALNDLIMVFIHEATGKIASFADSYEFDMATAFHDVGILTTPPHRGKDLGKALTREICSHLLASGIEPLYRCDEENVGSIKLSAGLGFMPVTQLVAHRFPVT